MTDSPEHLDFDPEQATAGPEVPQVQAPRGSEFGSTWVDLPGRIAESNRVLHNMVSPDQELISKEGSI